MNISVWCATKREQGTGFRTQGERREMQKDGKDWSCWVRAFNNETKKWRMFAPRMQERDGQKEG